MKKLFLFISVFVLVGNDLLYLDKLPIFNIIYFVLKLFLFVVLIVLSINKFKRDVIDKYVILFCSIYFVQALLNQNTRFIATISYILSIFFLLLLMKNFFRKDYLNVIKIFAIVFSFYIYVNFILVLLYPMGIWIDPISFSGRYIMGGNYNQMGMWLLLGIVTNMIYCKINNHLNFNAFLLAIVSMLTVSIVGSMTSVVGLILLLFYCYFLSLKYRKYFKIILTVFVAFFYIFVVYIGSDINNDYFLYFINNILNKDVTFSGRSYIWSNSIGMIKDSYLFGYGLLDQSLLKDSIGGITPHNMILSILIHGGFTALLILVILVFYSFRKKTLSNKYILEMLQFSGVVGLLMLSTETCSYFIIFYFLFLSYNINRISDERCNLYNYYSS